MWQEDCNWGMIKEYHANNMRTDVYQNLNDRVSEDLDLDDVFIRIDRTASKVGQQYLYAQLRSIPHNTEHDDFKKLVDDLQTRPLLKSRCRHKLGSLQRDESYYIQKLFKNPTTIFLSDKVVWLLNALMTVLLILTFTISAKFLIGALIILSINIILFLQKQSTGIVLSLGSQRTLAMYRSRIFCQ